MREFMMMTNLGKSRLWWSRWLLLLGLLLFVGSQPVLNTQSTAQAQAPAQFILVVHNSADSFDALLLDNVNWALNYARLPYDTLDLAEGGVWPNLSQYSALLFVAEELEQIDDAQVQRITNYVANGGGLAVVYRGWNPGLAPLFGMPVGFRPQFVQEAGSSIVGLRFVADFVPGVKGLAMSREAVPSHSLYDIKWPSDGQMQLIATAREGQPVAWLNQYGQGRTIFWNTDFLASRTGRGFITQSVLSVQPVGVTPVVNAGVIQIDDFPFPVSTRKLEPIKSEYNLTMVDFFDQVWLPDMMELARRFNIVYTCLIPFNYNANIEAPFDFKEWEHARVTIDDQSVNWAVYSAHLAAQGHELGLHGYNHVSLLAEYWVRDREAWAEAKGLLAFQEVVAAQERLEQLTLQQNMEPLSTVELAEKERLAAILDEAIAEKRATAEMLVTARDDVLVLTAQEQEEEGLSDEGKEVLAEAQALLTQAGPDEVAQAEQMLAMPDQEVADIVVAEAEAKLTEAGPDKVAEAAAYVAQAEQDAQNRMVAGLQEAVTRWNEDSLGAQPVSYVAPNNLYDPVGIQALTRAFPTIKIVSGSYVGDFETGANREFAPEPWNPELFAIPRATYSYPLTPSSRFNMVSFMGLMGLWTYFNHPDDVYHIPANYPNSSYYRNPNSLPWRGDNTGLKNGFYYRFEEWLEFAAETYPWLRYVSTSEALEIIQAHLDNQVTVDLAPDEVTMRTTTPTYFQVRVNNGRRLDLNHMQGARYVHLHHGEGYRLYILESVDTEVVLKLLPAQPQDTIFPPPATPPSFQLKRDDLQYRDSPSLVPVETVAPTATPIPTPTPNFGILPIPTPTLRSRP